MPPDKPKANYIEDHPAGSITYLHWNITMVKKGRHTIGVPSMPDQRVLSLDQRVCWQLEEHQASVIVANS